MLAQKNTSILNLRVSSSWYKKLRFTFATYKIIYILWKYVTFDDKNNQGMVLNFQYITIQCPDTRSTSGKTVNLPHILSRFCGIFYLIFRFRVDRICCLLSLKMRRSIVPVPNVFNPLISGRD